MSTINDNLNVTGQFVCGTFFPPAGCITNEAVGVADPIASEKIQQQRAVSKTLCDHGVDAATKRTHLYTAQAAGTLLKFSAGSSVVAGAATTLSIQLKKNGSNILSAALVLDNTNTAYVVEDAAGFTSAAVAAGDWLEVDATLAGTNEPQGVAVELVLNEAAVS